MVTAASENLMVAAETVRAQLRAVGPDDPASVTPTITLVEVLNAITGLAAEVKSDFAALHQRFDGFEKQQIEILGQLEALKEHVAQRDMTQADRHQDVMHKLDSIASEAHQLGVAAMSAQSEAIHARDSAAASERYVRDATAGARAERPSERPMRAAGQITEPMGSRSFESDAPPEVPQ